MTIPANGSANCSANGRSSSATSPSRPGKKSNYYVNSKKVLFHAEAIALLGELLYDATPRPRVPGDRRAGGRGDPDGGGGADGVSTGPAGTWKGSSSASRRRATAARSWSRGR